MQVCIFGSTILGHIVGREGLKMDPKKVQAISNIAYPTSKKEVRSFLGLAGYYRTFIPDFAGIGNLCLIP